MKDILTTLPLLAMATLMVLVPPAVIHGLMLLTSPHAVMVLQEVEITGTNLDLKTSTRTLMATLQLDRVVLVVRVVLDPVPVKPVGVEMDNGEMENTLLALPTLA